MKSQHQIAIPFPAIVEIQQGILEIGYDKPEKAEKLSQWLDELMLTDFYYPEATPAVARKLAEMNCCRPLKNLWYVNGATGKKPGMDLFIAAIAIVHNLWIATMDNDDFVIIDKFFPLPGVYNPKSSVWRIDRRRELDLPISSHCVPL
ncbi:hypothetical protein C8J35_11612 [Rhizobium sp. PP-F2F-G38]|nr:hypothetical protein C8J35_11612 [Rhizobium sp. PP-F2F-G38]